MAGNKSDGYFKSYVHDPLTSDVGSVRLESTEIDGELDKELLKEMGMAENGVGADTKEKSDRNN